ncbi:hypothetical protein I602_2732 [Polaribacter dokdonensis DSW-5]|uniref:Uncharacterized protein n=1 Tax=Polaribacter dokdonensis DSW-5 TaxID=1300348 RepID=A0A0M9CIE9_9FLAO|nr:hypothetical protein I602_2732 [Polaribacter dokdonensis DSW-5]
MLYSTTSVNVFFKKMLKLISVLKFKPLLVLIVVLLNIHSVNG